VAQTTMSNCTSRRTIRFMSSMRPPVRWMSMPSPIRSTALLVKTRLT